MQGKLVSSQLAVDLVAAKLDSEIATKLVIGVATHGVGSAQVSTHLERSG